MLKFPSCRDVAEQLSEDIDNPLNGGRWVKMKLHLLICAYCRRYGDQIKLSSDTVRAMDGDHQPSEDTTEQVVEVFRTCHGSHK